MNNIPRGIPKNASPSTIGWGTNNASNSAVHRSLSNNVVFEQASSSAFISSLHHNPSKLQTQPPFAPKVDGSNVHDNATNDVSSKSSLTTTVNKTFVPLPRPYVLEKHTSFNSPSNLSLESLVSKVSLYLEKQNMDIVYKGEKFKWKADSYPQNRLMSIRVQIYSSGKNDNCYVLEVIRRQGCRYDFVKLYQTLKAGICEDVLERKCSFRPPCVDSKKHHLNESSFLPLLGMCDESEILDVRREGIRQLANLSSFDHSKSVLTSSTCLLPQLKVILENLLNTNDPSICRSVKITKQNLLKSLYLKHTHDPIIRT